MRSLCDDDRTLSLIDRVDWIPKSERKEGIVLAMEMEWPSMFSLSAALDLYHIFIRYCC